MESAQISLLLPLLKQLSIFLNYNQFSRYWTSFLSDNALWFRLLTDVTATLVATHVSERPVSCHIFYLQGCGLQLSYVDKPIDRKFHVTTVLVSLLYTTWCTVFVHVLEKRYGEKKIKSPCRDPNPGTSTPHVSHYIDCTVHVLRFCLW